MKVVENIVKYSREDVLKHEYSYRMIEAKVKSKTVFGIEVERLDFNEGNLVALERDYIKYVSSDKVKVKELLDILAENIVSPIHLIDILGEYVDKYVEDMNEERAVAYN